MMSSIPFLLLNVCVGVLLVGAVVWVYGHLRRAQFLLSENVPADIIDKYADL